VNDHTMPRFDDKIIDLWDYPPCLAAAIEYVQRGWSVLPLCHPQHPMFYSDWHVENCKRPGKQPVANWKHLQERRLTVDELVELWRKNPTLNVGIIFGRISGIVGIDVDDEEGERMVLEMSQGDLPPTLEFSTPGGGRRLIYKAPADNPLKGTYRRGEKKPLTILGEGNYTVAPPSLHISGGTYKWKE
jgi:Bifunctional DNA primase/polymerase, N-terminal